MGGRIIEEDLFVGQNIVHPDTPEGQRIHAFLLSRAKALAGKYIDFDETPITFVFSDVDEPNAFFAPAPDPQEEVRRDQYKDIRYHKNPLDTPVICVTRGLIEMVDNLDQLDYVLGHELTHKILRNYGVAQNSKGEETIADLHGADLVYDAGGDPKQALVMEEKLSAYSAEKKKERRRRSGSDEEKESGIEWSRIFDVHMTDKNRVASLKASLTRNTHLVDERTPTEIDKTTFAVRYHDPVEDFLRDNGFENQGPLDKLRTLIDCIDHLSYKVAPEQYFQSQLEAIDEEDPEGSGLSLQGKRFELEERIKAGYTDYFRGVVVEKVYQQKIANLAEAAAQQVRAQKKKAEKGGAQQLARIDAQARELHVYLQNRAYTHIDAHGYPVAGDLNYLDASGIMYSYFYCLMREEIFGGHLAGGGKSKSEIPVQLELDIESEAEKIRNARTTEEFLSAEERYNHLRNILHEIRSVKYGYQDRGDKLDNLTALKAPLFSNYDDPEVFDKPRAGEVVPWNNLVEIAQTDDTTREQVVQFLSAAGIEDCRITHGTPYVHAGYYGCYTVDEKGRTSEKTVPEYEVDFAAHRETVLEAYDYIRTYFEGEEEVIDETCASALKFDEGGGDELEDASAIFNMSSRVDNKEDDFVSLFNSFPDPDEDERGADSKTVADLIPERHQMEKLIPGSKKVHDFLRERIVFEYSSELLKFDNPIFQSHFGEGFEVDLYAKKDAQQQKMFETAMAILEKNIDQWLEASAKLAAVRQEEELLSRAVWDSSDEEFKESKREELSLLRARIKLFSRREDSASNLLYNFLTSVYDNNLTRWQLQKLTPEQKRSLAEFAVRDERGAILKLFRAEGYERFCDYLGVMEGQTDKIISGSYEWTDMMRIVADNYGYRSANTREELEAYVAENKGQRYSRENEKYGWFLNVFDTMRYLEKTPEINVASLATALIEIKQSSTSWNGADTGEIVTARYKTYKKFVRESRLQELAAQAIGHQANYAELTDDELLITADALIEMRGQLATTLEGAKGSDQDEIPDFLAVTDKNINALLNRAESNALQYEDSFKKVRTLYRIYHEYGSSLSEGPTRASYLSEIDEKEGHLERISVLSEDRGFWPDDVLDHAKAYVFAKNTFLDDRELEDRLLNDILDKLALLPSGKKKNQCLHILLDKNLRAPFPETRERLFSIYTKDVSSKLGPDDGSARYQKRLGAYLNALNDETKKGWDVADERDKNSGLLANSMAAADKYMLLRQLSDEIISQEQTSQMLKDNCKLSLDSDTLVESYLYGVGVDFLTEAMDEDPETAKQFLKFLNSKGERKDCEAISAHIEKVARSKRTEPWQQSALEKLLENITPAHSSILYENFWSAPLEARAIIISRILNSAVNEDADDEHGVPQQSWERVFNVVMDNMISPDDDSMEALYARDIMHSYIKARSDYERELILSAMMVANRNIGGDAGNVGKALKLFLENMGPAEIKLGQAIASHPRTPKSISKELQELKDSADVPARWVIYDWIRAENIPEVFWKNVFLGEILGSASYYTTIALGEDLVLRLLRPESREKAIKGFRVIEETVKDLKEKDMISDLDYAELTGSVQEMVHQSSKMSRIETDHDIGEGQCDDAKDIYNGVTLSCGSQSFALKVMDWKAKGENWIIMDRAKGPTFNALPEDTPEQIAYKKQFAKAYIVFEIRNILSGRKFDHDKHGSQLCVDDDTDNVGIFDTGAMALRDPTIEEQKLLGGIIYDVLKEAMGKRNPFMAFSRIISDKIEELHETGVDTQYLVEVKKGLLALGDFFNVLDADDIQDILPSIDVFTDLSDEILAGLTDRMSLVERGQLKLYLATRTVPESGRVRIEKTDTPEAQGDALKISARRSPPDKSNWLREAFETPEDDPDPGSDPTAFRHPDKGVPECEFHLAA